MNLNFQDAILAASFGLFAYQPGWPQVCVILILCALINTSHYVNRQEKRIDLQKLEEKLAKAHSDIKAINLRLGFTRP